MCVIVGHAKHVRCQGFDGASSCTSSLDMHSLEELSELGPAVCLFLPCARARAGWCCMILCSRHSTNKGHIVLHTAAHQLPPAVEYIVLMLMDQTLAKKEGMMPCGPQTCILHQAGDSTTIPAQNMHLAMVYHTEHIGHINMWRPLAIKSLIALSTHDASAGKPHQTVSQSSAWPCLKV